MPANAVVRARIDEKTKKNATVVLKSIGLTPSAAFRLMMTRIATDRQMPFELRVPNAETAAAMKEGLRDEVTTVDSIDDLFKALHEVD